MSSLTDAPDGALLAMHKAWHSTITGKPTAAELVAHGMLEAEWKARALEEECRGVGDMTVALAAGVPTDPVTYEGLPVDVIAALRQAWDRGIALVDVAGVLGPAGYSIVCVPSEPEDDYEEQFAALVGIELPEGEGGDFEAFAKGPHKFKPSDNPDTKNCAVCSQTQGAWQHKMSKAAPAVETVEESRFTLGPWYIPDSVDAHGEWTDGVELQRAAWDYVRYGDRRIRLQHNTSVVAGEWVEILTWPWAISVPMVDPETGVETTVEYPAGTVFLGVVWEPWAWELVKAGKIRGFSIGGFSDRVEADLPDEQTPATKAAPTDPTSILAAAIAEAMKSATPTVNVVLPDTAPRTRRIVRNADGQIAAVVDDEE